MTLNTGVGTLQRQGISAGPASFQRLLGQRIAPQVVDLIEDVVLSPRNGIMTRLIGNIPTLLDEPLNDLDMFLDQGGTAYARLDSDLMNMSILASINAGNYEDLLKNWGTTLASMIYALAKARETANEISSTLTIQEIARRFDEDFAQAVMKEITRRFEGRYNRKAKEQAMIFLSLIQDGISGTFGSLFKLGVQGDRLNELREKNNDLESKAQQLISGLHQKFQLEQERLAQLGTSRAERISEREHEIRVTLINVLSNLALNQPRAARNLADSLMSVINRPSAPVIDLSAMHTSPVNGESEQVSKSDAAQPSHSPSAPNCTASKGLSQSAPKPKNHRGKMRRED